MNILSLKKKYQLATIISKKIPYRFTCNYCGKDSGWRYLLFKSKAAKPLRSGRFSLLTYNSSYKDQVDLLKKSETELRQMLQYQKYEVEDGKYRTSPEMHFPVFDDVCSYCHKHQKWSKHLLNI